MEHFPQVPGTILLDSNAQERMRTQPSQEAPNLQQKQAISRGAVIHGNKPWPH